MYLVIKRFFDFLFSLIALIILSPLLLIVIIILKFTGEREVFLFSEKDWLKKPGV